MSLTKKIDKEENRMTNLPKIRELHYEFVDILPNVFNLVAYIKVLLIAFGGWGVFL